MLTSNQTPRRCFPSDTDAPQSPSRSSALGDQASGTHREIPLRGKHWGKETPLETHRVAEPEDIFNGSLKVGRSRQSDDCLL